MSQTGTDSMNCTFCGIGAGNEPATIVYQDDLTVAFMDIHPKSPGHVLVIPREHARMLPDLDGATAAAVGQTLVRVAQGIYGALTPDGLRVQQANGQSAGQVVMHVHFHLIPQGASNAPRGRSEEEREGLARRIAEAMEGANGG